MTVIQKLPSQTNYKTNFSSVEVFLYETDKETEKSNVQFSDNRIVFVLEGRKEIYTELEKIELSENEGFLLKAGNYLITERFNKKNKYQSLSINFSNEILHKLLPQIKFTDKNRSSLQILKITQSPFNLIFLHSIQTYFQLTSKQVCWEGLLEMKLIELFLILLNSKEKKEFIQFIESLNSNNKISLELLMENHYKENLKINELAFLAGESISTLKRKFTKEFEITPHQWIQQRRLKESKQLLKVPHKNISNVCFECGFENLSHFIKLFKANFNLTPLQFRNELKKI